MLSLAITEKRLSNLNRSWNDREWPVQQNPDDPPRGRPNGRGRDHPHEASLSPTKLTWSTATSVIASAAPQRYPYVRSREVHTTGRSHATDEVGGVPYPPTEEGANLPDNVHGARYAVVSMIGARRNDWLSTRGYPTKHSVVHLCDGIVHGATNAELGAVIVRNS